MTHGLDWRSCFLLVGLYSPAGDCQGSLTFCLTGACLGLCFHLELALFGKVGCWMRRLLGVIYRCPNAQTLVVTGLRDGHISRPFLLRLSVSVTLDIRGVKPQRTISASDSIAKDLPASFISFLDRSWATSASDLRLPRAVPRPA